MKRTIISAAVLALGLAGAGVSMAEPPGPNGNNNHGLCTAYFAGSDTGREHKREAAPFQALEQAAGVDSDDDQAEIDQKVADYCAPFVGGNGNGNGNNGNPKAGRG